MAWSMGTLIGVTLLTLKNKNRLHDDVKNRKDSAAVRQGLFNKIEGWRGF